MEIGHWCRYLSKEPADEEDDDDEENHHHYGQSADRGKRRDMALSRRNHFFSVDLDQQISRNIFQSPSTEASLADETNSLASSGEWSRENSRSKDSSHEIFAPVFIVKNTFIDEVMPPLDSSRVRSSSAPPSPSHGADSGECAANLTGASATRLVRADESDHVVLPPQSTGMQSESLVLGTASLRLPLTAAPTAEPARLPLISVGAEVEIKSLSQASELNGLVGIVQGWEAETGHYDVMLRGSDGDCELRLLKLKPENIQCLDPPPPDFDVSPNASPQIPGPPHWDAGDAVHTPPPWDVGDTVHVASFDTMSLVNDAPFQHNPYSHNTMSNCAVFPPIVIPADAYDHHLKTGVFPWLPEAR